MQVIFLFHMIKIIIMLYFSLFPFSCVVILKCALFSLVRKSFSSTWNKFF